MLGVHERKSLPMRTEEWFLRHSRLYSFIRDRSRNIGWLYRIFIKLKLANPESQSNISERGHGNNILIPDEFRVWGKKKNNKVSSAWAITEALIVELKKEVTAMHSRLLVFYIPNQASIYLKQWQDTKKIYNISGSDWNINQSGIELDGICERNTIDLINPTEVFKIEADKISAKNERLYYLQDPHWNVNGNKLTARILADFILVNCATNK
jgi:hypothetical protein